ncbi:MAG: patatin-like phospholipase family protein [Bacteroidales bacterium]|nr:patatin-like phospholipase family protein [Bacteroidales bacterium]
MVLKKVIVGFIFLFGFSYHSFTQKVCLVLSGGGAKGASHIGVIQALEENNIPIDCIAGVSMGAIIGGMYASGYSTEEMKSILLSDYFLNIVSGEIPEKYKFFMKQESANATWIDLKLNYDSVKASSILPGNIVSPLLMDFEFLEIFSPSNAVSANNFDSLMVPLRFVAADIAAKKAVIFRRGDLAVGLRATMTFPFYFKPVRIDGKLMFDGGMYNNFPIDVAISEFNPDVIIGSKAASNYEEPDENDLVSQIQTMLMQNTSYSVPEDKGVLIDPELISVSLLDFSHTEELIDSAYKATIDKMEEIKHFIKRATRKEDVEAKRDRFNAKKPPFIINDVQVNGLNENQEEYVRRSLLRYSGQMTIEDLKIEYFKLLSEEYVKNVYPTVVYDKNTGFYDLHLDFKRERNLLLQFGGNISSAPINEAYVGVKWDYLSNIALCVKASSYIGRFYSSAQLDARVDIPFKTPVYIKSTLSFNQWDYFKTSTYFFEDKKPSYLIQNESHIDLHLGIPAGNSASVDFSGASSRSLDEYYQSNTFSRSDTADKTYLDLFSGSFQYEVNTLNKKQYANKGSGLLVSVKYIKGDETYEPGSTAGDSDPLNKLVEWVQFRVKYNSYFRNIGIFTLGLYVEVFMSSQELHNNYVSSVLSAPAFQPIPESKTLFFPNFRAYNYGAGGLRGIFALHKSIDFRMEGYFFQPYQEILENQDKTAQLGPLFDNGYYMGSAAFVYHSPIGPLSLSLNYYDQETDQFSFLFNIGYIIFNKRAID